MGHLQEIGVFGDCALCVDGQQTIDTCKEILDLAINADLTDATTSITPIELCLLDF